jgi:hypothetical protein
MENVEYAGMCFTLLKAYSSDTDVDNAKNEATMVYERNQT